MNKKGFTLIEILAVIVIIGIISGIGIVSISRNIAQSRDESVVDLAKNYAEAARTMRGKDNLYYEPKSGEAIIMSYDAVDATEIENKEKTGYGEIIPSYSFVGIVNNNNNYSYYINQVDESYHILDRVEYNTVTTDDILVGVDQLASHSITELKAPYNSFGITYGDTLYNIKGLRVKYDAKFNETGLTKFGTKNISGRLKVGNTVTLYIENSSHASIPTRTYTFETKQTNVTVGTVTYQQVWSSSSSSIKVAIKQNSNDEVLFDILNNNSKMIVENLKTTSKVVLSGYYTKDSSYASVNANHKGNITVYDTFKTTGKFPGAPASSPNVITYNGVQYVVTNSEILCIILKKN